MLKLVREAFERLVDHRFTSLEYLHPRDIEPRLKRLSNVYPDLMTFEEIGRSRTGEWPLYAILVGKLEKGKRVILWASQHHGPENEGATAAVAFIEFMGELCAQNDDFRRVLDGNVFVILPQQNPDGIALEGNWKWMKEPSLESYLLNYQYDVRAEDCEHGIPLDDDEQSNVRPEPLAFKGYVDRLCHQVGPMHFYLSGHSWSIHGGSLFLVKSKRTHLFANWATRLLYMLNNLEIPLKQFPPISGNYMLPEILPGFYELPMTAEMQKQKPGIGLKTHTLEYLFAYKNTPLVAVVEPPVFVCQHMQDTSELELTVRELVLRMAEKADERVKMGVELRGRILEQFPSNHTHLQSQALKEIKESESSPAAFRKLANRFPQDQKATKGQEQALAVTHAASVAEFAAKGIGIFCGMPTEERYQALFEEQLDFLKSLGLYKNPFPSIVRTHLSAIMDGKLGISPMACLYSALFNSDMIPGLAALRLLTRLPFVSVEHVWIAP